MKDIGPDKWNDRYKNPEYAYGISPNEFIKSELQTLNPGKILFPGEGEGRNAVYAAKLGWDVSAFDISEEGKKKAIKLADINQVSLDYQVGKLQDLNYSEEQFDVIGLIFAHFPASIKSTYHKMLSKLLRKGGIIIFEAFSKNHLSYRLKNEKVGGPSILEDLFSIDELKNDFSDYQFIKIEETTVELKEGLYHQGTGSVIRFVAQKLN